MFLPIMRFNCEQSTQIAKSGTLQCLLLVSRNLAASATSNWSMRGRKYPSTFQITPLTELDAPGNRFGQPKSFRVTLSISRTRCDHILEVTRCSCDTSRREVHGGHVGGRGSKKEHSELPSLVELEE